MLQQQLTSKNRPAELKVKLAGLLCDSPPTTSDESARVVKESSTLSRRLDLLTDQRRELGDQVSSRGLAVDDRLRQWSDWDSLYQRLTDQLSSVEARVNEAGVTNTENVVAMLQNVRTALVLSSCYFEIFCSTVFEALHQ